MPKGVDGKAVSEDIEPVSYFSRFMTLPTAALVGLVNGHLQPIDLAVMGALASHVRAGAHVGDWVYPSLARIGRMIGKGRSTVHRSVQRLEELGLLERRIQANREGGGAGRGATFYRLIFDAPVRNQIPAVGQEQADQIPPAGRECANEAVENPDQIPKSETKSQNDEPNPTQGGTEYLNLNKNTRAGAHAYGTRNTPDPIERLRLLAAGPARGDGGANDVRKWLSKDRLVWQGDDTLVVENRFQAEKILQLFREPLRVLAEEMGLSNPIQIEVRQ